MTPRALAAVLVGFGSGVLIWALCRAAARGDEALSQAWARRQREAELELEPWEHG